MVSAQSATGDRQRPLSADRAATQLSGSLAQIDVNKSQVQVLTQKQRLASLQNDLAKQKINLARLTGLPPNDRYELTDDVPFAEAPAVDRRGCGHAGIDAAPRYQSRGGADSRRGTHSGRGPRRTPALLVAERRLRRDRDESFGNRTARFRLPERFASPSGRAAARKAISSRRMPRSRSAAPNWKI